MNVLVDTPVWSLSLRRKKQNQQNFLFINELSSLVNDRRAVLIGPVRQEVLSGISNIEHFLSIRSDLTNFRNLQIHPDDYNQAAHYFNICRANGVQGSHIDFLICAVAERYQLPIFTSDKDFSRYAKHIPVRLYIPQKKIKHDS